MNNSQLIKDYKACERLMKKHSKTFYAAFKNLDETRAQAVYAIYAFCRIVDDYADVDHSLDKIEGHERQFTSMLEGNVPNHFMWRALADAFSRFQLESRGFYAQIRGQKYDMQDTQIVNEHDLQEYCYLVAGSVGEMMLPLLTKQNDTDAHLIALKLGEAMQITNILRDIGQDLSLNRCYLPKHVMEQFQYSDEMLQSGLINSQFIDMMDYMIAWALRLYHDVEEHIAVYIEEVQTSILLSLYYYRAILNQIIENDYDVFHKRAYVNAHEKMRLARLVIAKNRGV